MNAEHGVRLNPTVLTISVLASFILHRVAALFLGIGPILALVQGLLLGSAIGILSGWLWAIYSVSRRAVGRGRSGVSDWSFVVAPLIALIAGLAGGSTRNSPATLAIFAGLFVSLTLAAKGLENADDPNHNASVARILTTAIIMYFGPVGGAWILDRKIRRVASMATDAAR